MMKSMFLAATAALMVSAAPMVATAQVQPAKATADAKELSGTALLNKMQQEKAARENAEYEARVAAANQSVTRNEAQFQARTDAYEAEKHRVADQAADERLKWEADVKACEAGDKSRCAAPVTPN